MSSANEILRALERERIARKESERILETKKVEVYEQKLEIEALRRKLDEKVNRKSSQINKDQRFQDEVFESHPFSILIYSLDTLDILNVNETAVKNYGYSKSEFYKLNVTDLHKDQDKLVVVEHIAAIKSGSFEEKIWSHVKKNGEIAFVKITGVTTEFDHKPARIVVIEDITARKTLEAKNVNQQRKYADLVEKSSDLIFGMSSDGKFLFANNVTCKLTAYAEEELLTMNFSELIRHDYQKRVVSFYRFQLESRTETTYSEFPIISKEGEEIWLGQNVNISQDKSDDIEISAIARVITEKRAFEKSLLRSEEKLRSIIENMELGLLETDREGNIVKAYSSFCSIIGYAPEELEGTDGRFLLDQEGVDIMAAQQIDRVKGETGVYEIQLICKDKTKKWLLISGAPFYDRNNRFAGSIGVHLDISDRKKIAAELLTAKNIAENSLKVKEAFLANISHEIRTPLNAIIGLSEVLSNSQLDTDQGEMIAQVSVASSNLLSLINDLLLLSKIEANGIVLKPGIYSIQRTIEETAMMLENGAAEKGLEFILELDLSPNAHHQFDKLRFVQVIQNLVSNAIKFTSEGYVKISAKFLDSKEEIEISIEDSGIGILTNELNSVFDGFVQGSNNNPEIYGGTGLGLSIVHNIVDMMGGEVEVKQLDSGTCFTLNFSFPIKEVLQVQVQENEIIDFDISELEGTTVLVAEDNIVNQSLIEKILSEWNIDFRIVNNGKEAVETLENENFDVILMDIRMPVLNGIEATRIIRNTLKNYSTRIIAFTANALDDGNLEYWEAGFNDVLIKPFVQKDLLRLLIMNSSRKSKEMREQLIKFAQNDLAFAETLKSVFIEDSMKRVSDMKQALIADDYQQISDLSHAMKPSLAHLASENIQALNLLLESKKIDANQLSSKLNVFEIHMNILIEDLKKITL